MMENKVKPIKKRSEVNTVLVKSFLRLDYADWRNNRSFGEVSWKMARALNLWTLSANKPIMPDYVKIDGYIMAEGSVYLLISYYNENVKFLLDKLSKLLLKVVNESVFWEDVKVINISLGTTLDARLIYQSMAFSVYLIHFPWLELLLTGSRVELGYYNPDLDRLKSWVMCNPFCSLVDYSGAVGPVVIRGL